MVRLYHGSIADFDTFKISKENLRTKEDSLMEGMGIYFSESEDFAKSYGTFIYAVDLDEKDCWDCTKATTLKSFIKKVSKKVNFPVENYVPMMCIEGILSGDNSVTKFGREMTMWLDCTESFYSEYTEDADELFERILDCYENILSEKKFIKYYDKSFNCNIYLCRNKEDTLQFTKTIL
jgi:hypothetical protein